MQLYLALLAAMLLVGAAWLFVRRWRVAVGGARTTGRVVGFERREDEDSVFYLPVVEFTDGQDVLRRFTAVAGHTTQRPAVGTSVPVRYLPGKPEVAFIYSFLHLWAAPLAMAALGFGSLLACVTL